MAGYCTQLSEAGLYVEQAGALTGYSFKLGSWSLKSGRLDVRLYALTGDASMMADTSCRSVENSRDSRQAYKATEHE